MIENVMDICTNIINMWQSPMTKTEQFILHTVKDKGTSFVQIEGLNRSHTAIFKIRAKQSDLGLIFKYPCIYESEDALLRKWKIKRMDFSNIKDKSYWDLLKFDNVFNVEYDKFDCADLKRLLLNEDCEKIEIRNNGHYNVYNKEFLKAALIDYDLEDMGLKLIYKDALLRINYKWGIFDVYCLIAPLVEVRKNRFYLRV